MPINPVVALIAVAIVLPALLAGVEHLAEVRDRCRFPAPGRILADVKLHVMEQGTVQPAVILESGLAASCLSWVQNQAALSEFARVIAYDRPGLGWSAPSESPITLTSLLSALDSLTQASKVSEPLILVGHSFGGLLVQAFAYLHPNRVGGLVLIDPISIATYANPTVQNRNRILLGIKLSRRGAVLARFGIMRAALLFASHGSVKLPAFIGRLSARQGTSVMNRLASEIAKLPPSTHRVIAAYWSRPGSFKLLAEYLGILSGAARQARFMPVPAHIPVIVLSAATASFAELEERDLLAAAHTASRHSQIPETTHWLQLDRPDLVTEAVRELALLIK